MAQKFLAQLTKDWNTPNLKKNPFSLSFTHPMTTDLGKITPIFCEPISPNSSIRVNPSFGFEALPMIAPIQSHIRANVAYFFCPIRAIWDDFKKFTMSDITKDVDPSIAHPYISRSEHWTGVGTLADYFGIPCQSFSSNNSPAVNTLYPFLKTSVGSNNAYRDMVESIPGLDAIYRDRKFFRTAEDWHNPQGEVTNFPSPVVGCLPYYGDNTYLFIDNATAYREGSVKLSLEGLFVAAQSGVVAQKGTPSMNLEYCANYVIIENAITQCLPEGNSELQLSLLSPVYNSLPTSTSATFNVATDEYACMIFAGTSIKDAVYKRSYIPHNILPGDSKYHHLPEPTITVREDNVVVGNTGQGVVTRTLTFKSPSTASPDNFDTYINKQIQEYGGVYLVWVHVPQYNTSTNKPYGKTPYTAWENNASFDRITMSTSRYYYPVPFARQVGYDFSWSDKVEPLEIRLCGGLMSMSVSSTSQAVEVPFTPFEGTTPYQPISALPFRAYEAIYNSHFRNRQVSPFMKNGVVAVDDYNTNHGSGADSTTPVTLFRSQYPEDYFTGCLVKPLGNDYNAPVVGATNTADSDVTNIVFTGKDGVDYTIGVRKQSDGKISEIDHYSENADNFTINVLKEGIKFGITPQAITMVNALSKWYEASYRGGRYSYADFIAAHFGHPATHVDRYAPEYLGGFTSDMQMQEVMNTHPSDEMPMGATAGVASFSHGKAKPIECYADEEGFVIGVMWFTVDPINNQSIRKFWFRSQPSDYPTPELVNLGSMEVLNREIAPLQCDYSDPTSPDYYLKTFGYQRNHADLISAWDFSSGRFRSDMAHYLLQRVYGNPPVLGNQFLEVNPDDMNNVYAQAENSADKIYGFIHQKVTKQMWMNQTPNQMVM